MKKGLSILLALVLLFTAIPMGTLNVSAALSGTCGENVKWTYSAGTLTISGTGPMCDYEKNHSTGYLIPWFSHWENVKRIVIKSGVTYIGKNAFINMDNYNSVTIPNSVTKIGDNAFYASGRCTYLTLPGNLKEIGENAFAGWVDLYKVTIPGSVKTIGSRAFFGCSALNTVTINNGVTTIGEGAFEYAGVKTLTLPTSSLINVEERAFYRCPLPTVKIPKSLKNIGDGAFASYKLTKITVDSANPYYCTDSYGVLYDKNKTKLIQFLTGSTMTDYTVPKSVKTICGYAFDEARNLENVTLNDGLVSIGNDAFFNSTVKNINFPKGLTDIGSYAFYSCKLEDIVLPGSLKNIGDEAFIRCVNLKNIVFEIGIEKMGRDMFSYCEDVDTITLPYTLKSVSYGIQFGCKKFYIYEGWSTRSSRCEFIGRYRRFNDVEIICDNLEYFNAGDSFSETNILNPEQYNFAESQIYGCYNVRLIRDTSSNTIEDVVLGGPVTLRIRIPKNIPANACTLYKFDESGEKVKLDPKIEDGYFVLTTDSLGKYAVTGPVKRIFGASRYNTAANISNEGWKNADTVILANGTNYADALAGVPLAYKLDAPILLTAGKAQLEYTTATTITNLKASKVIILGGVGAISADIETALSENYTVERIYGATRYDTAVEISKHVAETPDQVFVVTGTGYADALSISPYAAMKGIPIVYSNPVIGLSENTANYLANTPNITAIGGEGAVPVLVETQLEGKNFNRIYGQSRYLTSFQIVDTFKEEFGNDVMFATGTNFPDALAGGVLGAKLQTPLLLTNPNGVIDEIKNYVLTRNPQNVYILGGEGAVPTSVINEIFK